MLRSGDKIHMVFPIKLPDIKSEREVALARHQEVATEIANTYWNLGIEIFLFTLSPYVTEPTILSIVRPSAE